MSIEAERITNAMNAQLHGEFGVARPVSGSNMF